MASFPTLDKFCELADAHDAVPVFRRLLSDSLTPVSAFKRIDNGGTACLFESVVGGENVGRYSFLAMDPQVIVSSSASIICLERGVLAIIVISVLSTIFIGHSGRCNNHHHPFHA